MSDGRPNKIQISQPFDNTARIESDSLQKIGDNSEISGILATQDQLNYSNSFNLTNPLSQKRAPNENTHTSNQNERSALEEEK